MKVKVILLPEQEGGYSVAIPALPGCVSEGDTLEEALADVGRRRQGCWEP